MTDQDQTHLPNRQPKRQEPRMAKPAVRAATPDFTSVLDTPSNEVSRPKPIAQGTYVVQEKGLPRIDKSTKKGTEFSEYVLQIMEACEDVDQEDLKYSLTKGNGELVPLTERSLRV